MSYTQTSFGPRDDWDPPALSEEDQTTEDLAALGMHTTSGAAIDDDEEDEDEDKVKEEGEIGLDDEEKNDEEKEEDEKDKEEEAVDGLKELERLERALQNDGRDMNDPDEE